MGDGVHEDLKGVLASEQENQLKSLLDNSNSHLLFTVVPSTGGHEHVGESLDEGALNLLEAPLLVAASSVRHVDLLLDGLDLAVAAQRHVTALDPFVGPLTKQLWLEGVVWSVVVAFATIVGVVIRHLLVQY